MDKKNSGLNEIGRTLFVIQLQKVVNRVEF
jgi:hypothetical protein